MLIPILRAAHCRSTHHFFAIDALERLGTERGRRLGELLLKHYARYLKGSKDPDDSFKDFQNHVIHVSQNNWGGAARASQQWLDKAMQHLQAGQWQDAAYACGVLSHYFTDPIMPLHTGQTSKESVVHRPMEWSICKAYEEIYADCLFNQAPYQLKLSDGDDWMSAAVLECAAIAHGHYDRLIEIYNLPRGVADPPRGLTKEARKILASLFDLAMGGWATILTRMANELELMPPDCSLTLSTVIAGIDVPRAFIVKKFSDSAQRAEVQRIFDEYTETGKLVDNLPTEIKVVRRERQKFEKESGPGFQPESGPGFQPESGIGFQPVGGIGFQPVTTSQANAVPMDSVEPIDPASHPTPPVHPVQAELEPDQEFEPPSVPKAHASTIREQPTNETLADREPSVNYDSPIVDAPSIGPKTANRFHAIGITTIGQFLDADAQELADGLATDWITSELIEDWQDQAALVCEVEVLCGYKAQLLVAIGCRTADDLEQADAALLQQAIADYAATKEGQRILRKAAVPDVDEVQRWIDASKPT